MIDFHSHILPDMDDGASSVDESLEMLRASKEQGVDIVYATPHFYAMDESPKEFVKRRQACYEVLKCAMEPGMPEVRLGAEVYWFPGMSFSEEVKALNMQGLPFLMVEPLPATAYSSAKLMNTGSLSRYGIVTLFLFGGINGLLY